MTVTASLVIAGLGPAGLERVSPLTMDILSDQERSVILRTSHHPAAAELAERRLVQSCDDLYESLDGFEDVYAAIAQRVLGAAAKGPVAYAVPGSAIVGERTVRLILEASGSLDLTVLAGESFLDLVYQRTGVDPIGTGAQILDGRDLPDPLPLHVPTIITQVDRPRVAADVAATLGKVLDGDTPVTVLDALGGSDERCFETTLAALSVIKPGPRTTLYLDPPPVGWHGLVVTNRRLRDECPWDRQQTHHSLLRHLIEETYETVEAVTALRADAPSGSTVDDADLGAYAAVEEELGDLLLQVVFHATLAREVGVFDVEEVAEGIRRKLVKRHPHVFGDVLADNAEQVLANWEASKTVEKGRTSILEGVAHTMPAISRADKLQRAAGSVGFDWEQAAPVLDKLDEEVRELRAADALADADAKEAELGDVLFAVVNVARHLDVDPELALRRANAKFVSRFQSIEAAVTGMKKDLTDLTLEELDALWDAAKRAEAG